MRTIGGELPLSTTTQEVYFTDSGRSSLRLLLRSGYRDKRFLIPDFGCQIIETVLEDEGVDYDFYHIDEKLHIDKNSLKDKEYDLFYVIHYFGQHHDLEKLGLEEKIVVEDYVFFERFENHYGFEKWYGFNSFRKVTHLGDGSKILTTLAIDASLICHDPAPFCARKYYAKGLKYTYLSQHIGSEQEYLEAFAKAEASLEAQTHIYTISPRSLHALLMQDFAPSQHLSHKQFATLFEAFGAQCLNPHATEFHHFVMQTPNRDALLAYLRTLRIYLPIHWADAHHPLAHTIFSIPIMDYYTREDIHRIITAIKEFYATH